MNNLVGGEPPVTFLSSNKNVASRIFCHEERLRYCLGPVAQHSNREVGHGS